MNGTPTHFTDNHAVSMTLRDYFAAKAMQAHVADGELVDACAFMNKDFSDEVARISYKMADAMLKAREA
jgi:hypothetical protein